MKDIFNVRRKYNYKFRSASVEFWLRMSFHFIDIKQLIAVECDFI